MATNDFTKPVTGDAYTSWSANLIANALALATALDPVINTSITGLPTGAIRFTAASKKWEKWSGSAWGDADGGAGYAINITGNAATATSAAACSGNAATATSATSATTATNSTQLGGVAAANFAQYGANQNWTKGQRGAVSAIGSGGATVTLDLNTSNNFSVTANTASWTLANPTNIASAIGQSGIIAVTQDATGSRVIAWGTQWVAAGGTKPVLSTAANATDLLSYYVIDSTHILVSAIKAVA